MSLGADNAWRCQRSSAHSSMMGKIVSDLGQWLTDWTAARKILFLHVTAHKGTESSPGEARRSRGLSRQKARLGRTDVGETCAISTIQGHKKVLKSQVSEREAIPH